MANSGRGDKPFEVDSSAQFLGDGIYVWFDCSGFVVIQRQPQYAEDENWWRVRLTGQDIEKIEAMITEVL